MSSLARSHSLSKSLYLKHARTLCLAVADSTCVTENHRRYLSGILNLKPLNSKISELMRCGFLEEAQKLFEETPQRNTVTWNAMIRGYLLNGKFDDAVRLFDRMPERDIFSYNTMIGGLMRRGDVDGARDLFDVMPLRDVVTWNSMIAGYVRREMLEEARRMFDQMPLRDVISWNLLISGLISSGRLDLAEAFFGQMNKRDVVSWTIMISGLVSAGRVVEARELFESMPTRDVRAWNAMIAGYIESGRIEIAEVLFHKMPERDLSSWSELLNGLMKNRRISDARRLFIEMPERCQKLLNSIMLECIRSGFIKEVHASLEKDPYSDVVSWTNVMVGYFGIGELEDALKLFEMIPFKDATVWNVAIFGLGENDRGEEGLKLFIRMKISGPPPDKATFTSVLTICSDLETLHLGEQMHATILKIGFNNFVAVSNAMVTMYARCGNMDSALLEFTSMPNHDIISWNSIICGLAHHGNGEKALEMFEQMASADVNPNDVTFVGVLSACSHAGMVDQGRHYFNNMRNKCLIQPKSEHYTCLVDLLGRFGLINEAMSLLVQMAADGIQIQASVWGALLGACRIHKNFKVGEIAGERILELEPHNAGVYLILTEMYLDSGRKEHAKRIRERMKNNAVKKQPGCSWVEVNNIGHIFLSGDSSHPEFRTISYVMNLLHVEMEIKISKSEAASF